MISHRDSHFANRHPVETRADAGRRGTARRLRAKSAGANLAAAAAIATALLAGGCTQEVEQEPEQTLESQPASRTMQAEAPRENPPLDGRAYRFKRKLDWWTHAVEVLFDGIDLSEEQRDAIDAILEAQLTTRLRLQELDAALSAARRQPDAKRIDAAKADFRAARAELREPYEIYEEMRAVLEEEQRPAFDMNRARHMAQMQGSLRAHPDESATASEVD